MYTTVDLMLHPWKQRSAWLLPLFGMRRRGGIHVWNPEETVRTMSQEMELLSRITVRPDIFGGKPIIRDMRFAVEHVLGMLAAGDTPERILREYPILEPEDIRACLCFAQRVVAGEPVCEQVAIREARE